MNNPETLATLDTQNTGRRQSRDTGSIGHTRHRTNKRQRKPKGQSRMDNPETLATLDTQYTRRRQTKQKRNTVS